MDFLEEARAAMGNPGLELEHAVKLLADDIVFQSAVTAARETNSDAAIRMGKVRVVIDLSPSPEGNP